jgi:hypothetical protein
MQSAHRLPFAECVAALRERRPEVFLKSAHFYLCWCLLDALAECRQEVVPGLARELAACAGRDIDLVNRGIGYLEYYGLQETLVEVYRIAGPLVRESNNVVPWGKAEFADKAANYEIFDYLERTGSPDADDPALLDRIRFFVDDPSQDYVREFIHDISGTSRREWKPDDFDIQPSRQRQRDDWDDDDGDDDDEDLVSDPGAHNLYRLINEFIGYLRNVEAVRFPRGELIRRELFRYFMGRSEGNLDPRPSMLELAANPKKKLPKPPRPIHPLCPERVTLEVYLAGLMDMMSARYHTAAALFQAMPAWLRFLDSRLLIDAATRGKAVENLRPLHATLLKVWERCEEDPTLYRDGERWEPAP